jgi:hypothetical protein
MVSAVAWGVIAIIGLLGPDPEAPSSDPERAVPSALARGNYPWYDAKTDSARPVLSPRKWNLEWLDRWLKGLDRWRVPGIGSFGDLFVIGVALLALTILLVVLVELWRRHRTPEVGRDAGWGGRTGMAARIEALPEGLRPETSDPWSEALRHRARGDFAAAIVCLFAHQLLALDRLRLVRLVPGRTGRQLVRAIDDRQFRAWVEPTLGLFEEVYYGHHSPTDEAFAAVWSLAEAFERRVAEGPVA